MIKEQQLCEGLPVSISQRVQGVFTRRHSRRDGRNLRRTQVTTLWLLNSSVGGSEGGVCMCAFMCVYACLSVCVSHHARSGVLSYEGVSEHLSKLAGSERSEEHTSELQSR